MAGTFVARLRAKLDAGHAPVCIGLDPRLEALPAHLLPDAAPAVRISAFCREVLAAVGAHTPVVKPNIAFFERYGAAGFAAYEDTCRHARAQGLLVIGDVKRGDIGTTAQAYAEVHLDLADAVTLHPLLGKDSVEPFLQRCATTGGAVFVLVRTSNASATELQAHKDSAGEELSDAIARCVHQWGLGLGDARDYSSVGAVVGATYAHELLRLRARMPRALILLPGVGAQGAMVKDALGAFDANGMGGLVNQSRGVTQCFAPQDPDWLAQVASAAQSFARALRDAMRTRGPAGATP
jgi:orotidine-5'-phosphate decarboxylase